MTSTEPEFAGHFEQLAQGRLCFPYCPACQRFHWYPMPLCPHCRTDGWQWRAVQGSGMLYSWTEVHHAFDARYGGALPYIVALIEFVDAPGIRLVSNLVGAASQALTIGQSVTADFSQVTADGGRLVFRVEARRVS